MPGQKGKPLVTHHAILLLRSSLSSADPLVESWPHPEAKVKIRQALPLYPDLSGPEMQLYRSGLSSKPCSSRAACESWRNLSGVNFSSLDTVRIKSCLLVLKDASGSPLTEENCGKTDVARAHRSLSEMKSRCLTTGRPVPPEWVLNVANLPAAGQFTLIASSLGTLSLMRLWLEGSSPSTPLQDHLYTDSLWQPSPMTFCTYWSYFMSRVIAIRAMGFIGMSPWGRSRHMKQAETDGDLNVPGHPAQTALGEDGTAPVRPWVFVLELDEDPMYIFHRERPGLRSHHCYNLCQQLALDKPPESLAW